MSSSSLALAPFTLGLTSGLLVLPLLVFPHLCTGDASSDLASAVNGSVTASSLLPSQLLSSTFPLPFPSTCFAPPPYLPLILLGVLLLICCHLYRVITRPLVYDLPLSADDYEAALHRPRGDAPPPYPTSWYRLCCDCDLRPSIPLTIQAFAHRLTLRRTVDGVSCVDEKDRTHEAVEANQSVLVWWDERGRSSSWQVPVVPHDLPRWRFLGRVNTGVACHVQEIAENGPDCAHLQHVHGPFLLPIISQARHTWKATWQPRPAPHEQLADVHIASTLRVCSRLLPSTLTRSSILQVGPGLVHITIDTPTGHRVFIHESVLPQHPFIQQVTNVLYAEPGMPSFIAKLIAWSAQRQFERDLMIWQNKKLLRAPLIMKADGPILLYRRWMRQFYDGTESSEGEKK